MNLRVERSYFAGWENSSCYSRQSRNYSKRKVVETGVFWKDWLYPTFFRKDLVKPSLVTILWRRLNKEKKQASYDSKRSFFGQW